MSLGFLTESALIPKKAKEIKGVASASVRAAHSGRRRVWARALMRSHSC